MNLFDIPGYFNFLVIGFLVGLTFGAYAMDIANAEDEEEQNEAVTPTSYALEVKHGHMVYTCDNGLPSDDAFKEESS